MSFDRIPLNAALIIIDVQKGFDEPVWGKRNNPRAEENMARLLEAWRRTARPVFHVRHRSRSDGSPLSPASPGFEIKDEVKPLVGEPLIEKEVNSAFIGTDLESRLRKNEITTVVIIGLTTDHCVSTTARMAGNLGFNTFVVADATATFDRYTQSMTRIDAEQIHAANLASLHEEFATVISTEETLRKLM